MPTIDPDTVSAPTVISVTDYGAIPNSGQDAVMAVGTMRKIFVLPYNAAEHSSPEMGIFLFSFVFKELSI